MYSKNEKTIEICKIHHKRRVLRIVARSTISFVRRDTRSYHYNKSIYIHRKLSDYIDQNAKIIDKYEKDNEDAVMHCKYGFV